MQDSEYFNVAQAEQDVKNLKEDLAAADEASRSRVTRKLNLAKARLAAATGKLVL